MTDADKLFKAWYEKRTGKQITPQEIKQATRNMVRFVRLLAGWEPPPERDSNSETSCSKKS